MSNIKISPEELQEHSTKIEEYAERIFECIQQIKDAKQTLASWNSPNKEMFFQKLDDELKKMVEMTEAAKSYGSVGNDVAARVLGVENNIKETIMKMNEFDTARM